MKYGDINRFRSIKMEVIKSVIMRSPVVAGDDGRVVVFFVGELTWQSPNSCINYRIRQVTCYDADGN